MAILTYVLVNSDRLKIFDYRDRKFKLQQAITIMIGRCLLNDAIAFKTMIDTSATAFVNLRTVN